MNIQNLLNAFIEYILIGNIFFMLLNTLISYRYEPRYNMPTIIIECIVTIILACIIKFNVLLIIPSIVVITLIKIILLIIGVFCTLIHFMQLIIIPDEA